MTASIATEIPAAPQAAASVGYFGKSKDFMSLLVRGALLQIPTFGFYRFWLVTKLRRHLWSNTQVAGETFEYTGTAKELLIGFLIALAVLIPIYIAFFIVSIMLGEKHALATLPFALFLYPLLHFAAYRARRYRATRTAFRGVRFWMTGAGWAYAAHAFKWNVGSMLTLGLAWPWSVAALERYRMRNTYFGSLQGDFIGTGAALFKRLWLLVLVMIVMAAGWLGVLALLAHHKVDKDTATVISVFTFVPVMLVFLVLYPMILAVLARWQMEGIRFGAVTVSSNLGKRAFVGTFFKLLFSGVGLVFAFFIIAAAAAAAAAWFNGFKAEQPTLMTWVVMAVILVGYLGLLLGLGIIRRYFMGRGLWEITARSLTVSNLSAIDVVAAAGQASGSVGEGLADALDFDVGI